MGCCGGGCYCGCAPESQNRRKWATFAGFSVLGVAFLIMWVVAFNNCYEDEKNEDGSLSSSSEVETCPVASVGFYLMVLSWIFASIPLYMMCCCTPPPPIKAPGVPAVAYGVPQAHAQKPYAPPAHAHVTPMYVAHPPPYESYGAQKPGTHPPYP